MMGNMGVKELVELTRAKVDPNADKQHLRRRIVSARAALRDEKAEGGEPGLGFVGHAAVFNQRTYIGRAPWGFFEEIAPGAFDPVLSDDVRMLLNHDSNYLLARTRNGTLRLSEDNDGLFSDADMAPVTYARDLAVLLDRGDMDQMSFAFWPAEEAYDEVEVKDSETGTVLRAPLVTITKMERLYDVSPVTYPAYEGTDAGLRFGRAIRDDADVSRIARAMLKKKELDEIELRSMELRPAPAGLRGVVNQWT